MPGFRNPQSLSKQDFISGTPEPAIITMNGYIRIARGYHRCDNPDFAVADQADFMMIDL